MAGWQRLHTYGCELKPIGLPSARAGVSSPHAFDDAVATGFAIVLFWPEAFLVGGNDQTTAELARLRGEFDAIEHATIQKNCGHRFHRSGPPPRA
ncbi:MAG: hypothetical protein AB7E80_15050 [Hyphomicrobiaceae bacterium]